MSERLAWARAVLAAEDEFPEWCADGREIIRDLRGAMHGEADPRDLSEERVRHWQEYGQGMEVVAASSGLASITLWLEENPGEATRVARE